MTNRTEDIAQSPIPAVRLGLQPVLLFGFAAAAGLASALVDAEGLSFVLMAMSGGCLGASILILLNDVMATRRRHTAFARALETIEHDPTPCFITDESGNVAAQNPASDTYFGPRKGQTIARALASVLPNAASVAFRHGSAVARGEAAQEVFVTPRGAVRLLAHPVPFGTLWRLEDGGDLQGIGEKIALPLMLVDHSDRILNMNDAATRILGREAATLDEIFPDRPLIPGRRTHMVSEEGTIEVIPVILSSRDGRREVYAIPGLAEPPAASVAARAFESLPVALLHLGLDGSLLASNKQAQILLGISPDEDGHLGSMVEGLGRPVRDWVADTLAERIPSRSEVVRARRRTDECFLQIALNRITDATGPSLLAVLHDATELKSLEQQFVQSQKMQAVGELAGGVAHDFNNLLTAITGHCDLLLMRRDPGHEDYSDLIQINQNANRAAALVGQLLAFSRQQKLQLEVFDLRDTLGELTHLLNRLVGEKVSLSLTDDPDLQVIRADRQQLDQVIVNLVVNARDAMPDGGQIAVETRMLQLSEPLRRDNAVVPSGQYVALRVRDDGHGIPPDKLNRIFEPFFTTKDVGKGTGLGLSMSYGIVKQTGGYIFVDSAVGSGTTFTIYIPAHNQPTDGEAGRAARDAEDSPNASEPDAEPPILHTHASSYSVLLVEDEAPVRAFASRALRLRGYDVLEAGDAETALEMLRDTERHVDLFVTDVVMPGKDGPTWVREALAERPDVRVIFVSGYSEADIIEMTDGIPDAIFLPKPFSLVNLTDAVAQQLA